MFVMDKEIAAAIIIIIIAVIAFAAVRLFAAGEFNACMDSCENSAALGHARCSQYCEALAEKGIIVLELPE